METHSLMGGRLHVYKRDNSRYWQCSTYLAGRNRRISTKEESLSHAKEVAEDWFFELKGKLRAGEIKEGKTFRTAADQFQREYQIITQGQRSPRHVRNQNDKIRLHLIPYFGNMVLSTITAGTVQEYRVHRAQQLVKKRNHAQKMSEQKDDEKKFTYTPPSRSTIHHEIVALRQVLKTAQRHGWIDYVPDFSAPYKSSGKIVHRAWFSPSEYRELYQATRAGTAPPTSKSEKAQHDWKAACDFHDYVLFMANTGVRPDEAARLEYRDVKIEKDAATRQTILVIEVRGKRGVGYCKSTTGAVGPFLRLRKRHNPAPTDRLFPVSHRKRLTRILHKLGLKTDRDGNQRTAYSLRHTYICLRLMEGADIYQIAKNCRTSVEMIERHYAVHIKNTLDAAAINVRRPRPLRPRRGRIPKPPTKELDNPA